MAQVIALSSSQIVERLKAFRESGVRKSAEVVRLAEGLLNDITKKNRLGEDAWAVYEQVAIAALDIGKIQLAEELIRQLETRFPGSPRVMVLHGMLLEASGDYLGAKDFYEVELARPVNPKSKEKGSVGESNIRIRKRLIALHLHQSTSNASFSIQTGIQLLVDHLDTVYSDPESWLQLAEVYASLGRYQQSLAALEDLILLQPDNTFHLLRYAETAYTAGQIELAYKTYLRVIELSDTLSDESKGGPCRRAAVGLKLCVDRLPSTPNSAAIKGLLQDELLACYSQDWVPFPPGIRVASEACRKVMKQWIERPVK